jgi:hypothetical protein
MYIKSACDECLPCLLEKVSGLESQAAKDEGAGDVTRIGQEGRPALATPLVLPVMPALGTSRDGVNTVH